MVELAGPLGAGKTTFVKGLAAGLGLAPDAVASPTFVIAHEHALPAGSGRRLVHVDGYRLADEDELEAAGWSDWLVPGTLVVVEWGDRFPDALPADRLRVALGREAEAGRSAPAPAPGAPAPAPAPGAPAPGPDGSDGPGGQSRRIAVSSTGPRAATAAAGWREALARASIPDLDGP